MIGNSSEQKECRVFIRDPDLKTMEKELTVKGIRKKHLDRREWYTGSERDYACMYHSDSFFRGGIGLITFTGLKHPETVDTADGPLCIADNGYQWLELAPEGGHYTVTAMFHDDTLFQQYIDITLRNDVPENGDAAFYDLLLDIVVLQDGTPRILDSDELEESLSGGIITREEYDLARQTADEIVGLYRSESGLIVRKLYEYRALFSKKEE